MPKRVDFVSNWTKICDEDAGIYPDDTQTNKLLTQDRLLLSPKLDAIHPHQTKIPSKQW